MVKREVYLEKLIKFKDKDIIKMITMDRDLVTDINGVKKVYAVDWLLGA